MGAADMIRRRGLHAMSVRELAKHADAPLGSTYHYFPGGKNELATDAIRWADHAIGGLLSTSLEAGPVEGLHRFLAMWRAIVLESNFAAGCPVLAVSVEEPPPGDRPDYLVAAAAAFASWQQLLADSLRGKGVKPREADDLAALVVAAVEGTVAMCRATADITPLDRVGRQLDTCLARALATTQA